MVPRRRPRGRSRHHGHGNPIITSIHGVARLSRAAGKLRLRRYRGSRSRRDLRRVKHVLEETWAFLRGVVGNVDARDLPLALGLFFCPSMRLAMAMTEQLVLDMDAADAAGHGEEAAAAGACVEE